MAGAAPLGDSSGHLPASSPPPLRCLAVVQLREVPVGMFVRSVAVRAPYRRPLTRPASRGASGPRCARPALQSLCVLAPGSINPPAGGSRGQSDGPPVAPGGQQTAVRGWSHRGDLPSVAVRRRYRPGTGIARTTGPGCAGDFLRGRRRPLSASLRPRCSGPAFTHEPPARDALCSHYTRGPAGAAT